MMYTIKGTYALKLAPTGHIVRSRSMFEIRLNTPQGVLNFIDEMKPFTEIKVIEDDLINKKDVTNDYVSKSDLEK